ncbi:DNA-directed RNA polymerase, mitochondrial [Patella vulgata]|uniref:DNA-directed RNA polymerase, mitochondrial n=1 Tax=Patella vulgata TaxID=6465 RepID=UPI0024A9918F|nr:DNA-directed RNA polymerase, mitochondrial [Patella vulgata]
MSRLLRLNCQLYNIYAGRCCYYSRVNNISIYSKDALCERFHIMPVQCHQTCQISTNCNLFSNSLHVKQALMMQTKKTKVRKRKKGSTIARKIHRDLTAVLGARVSFLAKEQQTVNKSSQSSPALNKEAEETNINHPVSQIDNNFPFLIDNPNLSKKINYTSPASKVQLFPKTDDIIRIDAVNFGTLVNTKTTDTGPYFSSSNCGTIDSVNVASQNANWLTQLSAFKLQMNSCGRGKNRNNLERTIENEKLQENFTKDENYSETTEKRVFSDSVDKCKQIDVPSTETVILNEINNEPKHMSTNSYLLTEELNEEFLSLPFKEEMSLPGEVMLSSEEVMMSSEEGMTSSEEVVMSSEAVMMSSEEAMTSSPCNPEYLSEESSIILSPQFTHGTSSSLESDVVVPAEEINGITSVDKGKDSIKKKLVNKEKLISNFNVDKKSFVEACCSVGKHRIAHNCIKYYNCYPYKLYGIDVKITDINIYNILIHSWAKQMKTEPIEELMMFIRKDNLVPNYKTYAGYLECLGRPEVIDETACRKILDEMVIEKLDVKDLFNECTFKRDERQCILKAIQSADPYYIPNSPPEPKLYEGELLSPLNDKLPPDQVIESNPFTGVLSTEEIKKRAKLQLNWELKGSITVSSIYKKPKPTDHTLDMREKLCELREEWRKSLIKAFKNKLKYYQRKSERSRSYNIYPFLKMMTPYEYAELALQEIKHMLNYSETYSPRLSYLRKALGNKVWQHCLVKEKIRSEEIKKMEKLYELYAEEYNKDDFPHLNHRQCWHQILNDNSDGPSLVVEERVWPVHVKRTIGRLLYDLILQEVRMDSSIFNQKDERKLYPAFFSIYRTSNYKTFEEIKPHPDVIKLHKEAQLDDLDFNMSDMPMLVPPVPWLSLNHGGTLLSTTKLIRLPELAFNQMDRLQQLGTNQINAVLDSLNTLSACAWIINKTVLDLVIDLFNTKGNVDLDIPPPVTEFPALTKYPRDFKSLSPGQKAKLHRERNQIKQKRSEMFSLWCTELYRLSIANRFRDEIFWFPHNLDFRGRTYPTPPHFNHLGSDLARSLLIFAKGKPLGERGLDWLKIHLVNLTGFKKRCSNDERLAFANEMLDEIQDSADNPFTGDCWWQTSDEPWQTLACCIEITNAIRSPDITKYISHFPVHQDGSCNGLQHYAALGRDQSGAESVNLSPFSKPQDVYSDVAEMVERQRSKDAAEGNMTAIVLEGFVRRKVIKQTVMTTVYGVTKYGARLQIIRQLKDIPDMPQEYTSQAASYLTEKTFLCLQEMFTATKGIQEWLRTSARALAIESKQPVEWVTPLGLPIVQPYHKKSIQQQHGVQLLDDTNKHEKPNIQKQMNAFPPNFIHSLDSTHMMLTSLYCLRKGITYVSVHDCYWTHATDVPVMNKICREQFVNLHNQPILEDLSNYLIKTFLIDRSINCPDTMNRLKEVLMNVPERGNFDLSNVLDSTYFFS